LIHFYKRDYRENELLFLFQELRRNFSLNIFPLWLVKYSESIIIIAEEKLF